MKKILNLEDIKLLVDTFYDKIREDALLGPIFKKVIGDHWALHLDKMYRFWQTVLLEEMTYKGSPFLPHQQLPIDASHFERWLAIFYENIDAQFEGEKAVEAKWRAEKMAQMFQFKIQYYRDHKGMPLQ